MRQLKACCYWRHFESVIFEASVRLPLDLKGFKGIGPIILSLEPSWIEEIELEMSPTFRTLKKART